MKFNEFYNKQKNVIKASIARRIESNIPISEERDAFYKGELFKKYDIVESEGKQYTILEQASNYYHVVDSEGNLSRKFPKQLTKISHGNNAVVNNTFHGYELVSEEAIAYLNENYSPDCDDVGILKQVKQLDEQMDSYKTKDKLTVAKIIADAVGVPHDVVSTPENLVSAAIRKAKKDPKLVKNKEILSNMLQIAREVGIKITDDSFDIKESEEIEEAFKHDVDHMPGAIRHDLGNARNIEADREKRREYEKKHVKTFIATREKDAKEFADKHGHKVVKHEYPAGHKNMYNHEWHVVKESEEITEESNDKIFKNPNAKLKGGEFKYGSAAEHKKAIKYHKDEANRHAESDMRPGHKKEGIAFHTMRAKLHQDHLNSLKESEEIEEAAGDHRVQVTISDPNHPAVSMRSEKKQKFIRVPAAHSKDSALSSAKKYYQKQGMKVHSVEHVGHVNEDLEEALTYKQVHTSWVVEPKSKKEFNTPFKKEQETEAKAHAEKTGGKLRKVDQRGHIIKANAVHESENSLTLSKLRLKLSEAAPENAEDHKQLQDIPQAEVKTPGQSLPHGHTLNPTTDTHRKQLIKKLRGD